MEREKDGGREVDLEWQTERGRAGYIWEGRREMEVGRMLDVKDWEMKEEMSQWRSLRAH